VLRKWYTSLKADAPDATPCCYAENIGIVSIDIVDILYAVFLTLMLSIVVKIEKVFG